MPPFEENIPLSSYSTFGIGGPARYFIKASSIQEMQDAIQFCNNKSLPFLVLGKGSNCLFDEKGYNGCVILNKISHYTPQESGYFTAGAGFSFALLGVRTASLGFTGLEFASGIPASVGGAVYMNAGANGSEVKDCLDAVDFIDESGNLKTLKRSDLTFSYRFSTFQTLKGAIVSASFQLKTAQEARKKQLEIVSYRTETQPYGEKSAGCVFRNPPSFFAGELIEKAGLKGVSVGGAKVSEKHANFIVNKGSATSLDVLNLIKLIQQKVESAAKIHLENEIRIIPYDPLC